MNFQLVLTRRIFRVFVFYILGMELNSSYVTINIVKYKMDITVKKLFWTKLFLERVRDLRVHQKKTSLMPENLNNVILFDTQTDYKRIYENTKNYIVFKISIVTNPNSRLAYLDVLDYMEHVQLEAVKK